MKKGNNRNILMFIISIITMGINYLGFLYLPNLFTKIVLIILTSLVFIFLVSKLQNKNELKSIIKYISNINDLEFNISEIVGIPSEVKEGILDVYKEIRDNLKTQVEISTEIFNICEELGLFTGESLKSAELVADSVDSSNNNIVEQNEMLKSTNELASEIYSSMENIEKDVNTKIEFISSSINTAQNGIETFDHIESRINNSKNMVGESSTKIDELSNYFDEVVGFVDLINGISNQTQLLSLNASIEAARAGEEGRGFAIVAMEVGKLAAQTESVSKKIEEVIKNLKIEINHISKSMGEEMKYMEENAHVVEKTNREFRSIIDTLNVGKDSLEEIKEYTGENTTLIEDINHNIEKIFGFSHETTEQMEITTNQIVEQHERTIRLNDIAKDITGHVHDMQQFVVGKAMEEKMLKQAHESKAYFLSNKNINEKMLQEFIDSIEADVIYITDASGKVEYTNVELAKGINLYEIEPTFLQLKEGTKDYVVTPIKKRAEDDKLFKFLTIIDEDGRLYDVGLGLQSLLKNI